VAGKIVKRVKHVPQRTCVGCRQVLPKRSLVRVVKQPDGVIIDPTGKAAGRGAYLHNRRLCWELGLKGSLAHALRTDLTDQDEERLRAFLNTLPEDEPADSQKAPSTGAA
jgi:predicted RNA-binding protein YlxR (DUF448 family)